MWAYYDTIVSRFHHRRATAAEIAAAMLEEPSEDLVPPRGLLLLARRGEVVLGCAGLRLHADVADVPRVHFTSAARGPRPPARLAVAVRGRGRGPRPRAARPAVGHPQRPDRGPPPPYTARL